MSNVGRKIWNWRQLTKEVMYRRVKTLQALALVDYLSALYESCWLRGSEFFNWEIIPFTDVITKIKSRKFAHETEMMKKEIHEMLTLKAHVTTNASTFERQKYSCYEKLLLIVAYMLRILVKFSGTRTNTGYLTDLEDLLEAERKLFLLVQTESFLAKKNNLLKLYPSARLRYWLDFAPSLDLMNCFVQPDILKSWKLQPLTWNILFCLIVIIFYSVFTGNIHTRNCWVS